MSTRTKNKIYNIIDKLPSIFLYMCQFYNIVNCKIISDSEQGLCILDMIVAVIIYNYKGL